MIERPQSVAAGPRPLIVFSTKGGQTDHELYAYLKGGFNDSLKIEFTVYTLDESVSNFEEIEASATFFGPDGTQGVSCEEKPVPMRHWNDLGEGTRAALAVDRVSGSAGAHPLGALSADPHTSSFPQWSGKMGTITKRNSAQDRKSATLDCVISKKWVWHEGPRKRSALLPQINYTSIGDVTDHQRSIKGSVSLSRDSGWILSESYPQGQLQSLTTSQDLVELWNGRLGEKGNLGYLLHSDMLFIQRGTEQNDVRILTVAGIVLGVAGSLVVSAFARVVDLLAARFIGNNNNNLEDDLG
ncbi:hypothetical protein SAMN04488000_13161 [Lentzea albida]|uniref:Uncharacterized protein n=1 Tax=Lentzea albida TaxID=65499 RepID=A0A1H9XBJ7_9PSEU|nr:hypothetical protein SAMN04488000_13161 [Lentzea albida]